MFKYHEIVRIKRPLRTYVMEYPIGSLAIVAERDRPNFETIQVSFIDGCYISINKTDLEQMGYIAMQIY